ncbi:hypothetical protein Vretimale_20136, partial [Volvox reticuliferus]
GIIPCLPPSVQNVPTNFLCVFGSTWTWMCFPPTPGNYSVPPTIRTECSNDFSVCVFGSIWTWLCFPPTPGNYSVPPTIRTECPNDFSVCFWLDLDLAVLPPDAWELFRASHHPYRMSQRIFCVFLARPGLGCASPRRLGIIPCLPPSVQNVPTIFLCVFLARSGLGCASPRRLGIIPCLPPSVQNVPTNSLCVFGSIWTWLCFPPTPGNHSVPPTIHTECPNEFSVCFWLDLDLVVLPPDAWELFRASHNPYRMSQRIFCVFLARPGLGCASPRRLGNIPCLPPSVQNVPTIFLCVFLAQSGLGCAFPRRLGIIPCLPPSVQNVPTNSLCVFGSIWTWLSLPFDD